MELEAGDYIVHAEYGIGQYIGVETREQNGVKQDYLHVIVPRQRKPLRSAFSVPADPQVRCPRTVQSSCPSWAPANGKRRKRRLTRKSKKSPGVWSNCMPPVRKTLDLRSRKTTRSSGNLMNRLNTNHTPDQLQATAEIKAEMEKAKPTGPSADRRRRVWKNRSGHALCL